MDFKHNFKKYVVSQTPPPGMKNFILFFLIDDENPLLIFFLSKASLR